MTLRRPIPNKLFFRIGEVAEITGVQMYTLRYWEREFPTLRPRKNESGQRSYRAEDIEMVLEIQRLLMEEGYTAAGARRVLGKRGAGAPAKPAPQPKPTAASPAEGKPAPAPADESGRARRLALQALALMDRTDAEIAGLGIAAGDD